MLAEIGDSSSSDLIDDAGGLKQDLGDFAQHYTMQAERDVHETVTRGVDAITHEAKQPKPSELAPEKATDLGGDVEFF